MNTPFLGIGLKSKQYTLCTIRLCVIAIIIIPLLMASNLHEIFEEGKISLLLCVILRS